MKIWRWVFVGLVCTAFILRIDAVELGRRHPTERISGQILGCYALYISVFISILVTFLLVNFYLGTICVAFAVDLRWACTVMVI